MADRPPRGTLSPMATDLDHWVRPRPGERRVSAMAEGIIGSEILKIAADIRALAAAGRPITNLTVGDFDPSQFPIPERLRLAIVEAYDAHETNYPPSSGMLELRAAVKRHYERDLGLKLPIESFLVCGGARPVIYGIFRAVVDPGDVVLYPVPSWNNNHYVHMSGARGVAIECGPETRFQPTPERLLAPLREARLVCLNSPTNPTGTTLHRETLLGICQEICEENARRKQRGERPVFLMYDQIYWMLSAEGAPHVTPLELVPEMASYTVFVDGISKAFAATGVRVGWAVGPTDVIDRMSSILGHVGAWAPRAEQLAAAKLLDDAGAIAEYIGDMRGKVQRRLNALHIGFQALRAKGLPVDSLAPEGAIYLTVQIAPFGKRTPSGDLLRTNEDVRHFILEAAGVGIVPFQAFGYPADDGWFRMSVGAVSEREAEECAPRIGEALGKLGA